MTVRDKGLRRIAGVTTGLAAVSVAGVLTVAAVAHAKGATTSMCAELLPELLARDEWGYPLPRDGAPEPTVPPNLSAPARRAVTHCPRLALRLRPP